ncbi:RNA polymerase sigma factor [Levilactobacillus tujiorum]|uniref:RNA polymerase sigma factor n=1 Tax=Levilactobacillus tujiorum TaxID=2912243 RepID=UPI001456824A|nr:RNA polymerase sigma factor [Levilactobacillus tujiorum]NLR31043.1 RNA polymerase sigma factor [Levilactobacillus tujiorum]
MQLKEYEDHLAQLTVDLRHYLVSRGARPETAEDICQDVFIKLLEMELVLPLTELRPYVYRVAWTTYLDHYRRTRRYQELVEAYLRPVEEGTTAEPEWSLIDQVAGVSSQELNLLRLRYDRDLPIREIAVRLGVKPATVKMRLFRIHRKLEKKMRRNKNE